MPEKCPNNVFLMVINLCTIADLPALMASDGMTCKLSVFQVSVSQVLAYLKSTFPGARQVSLRNCVACELHVTLTQQPSNIAYMRQVCKIALFSVNYPGIGIG